MNTTNGGITVLTTMESSYSISVLIFNPLRTSHGDIYICEGAIDSPAFNSSQTTLMQETVMTTVQSMLLF